MTDNTTSVGRIGEAVAVDFLQEKGYQIEGRNFRRKYGELDIIARKESLVFVEVKSVRCRIPEELPTEGQDNYRPEENVGDQKRRRLRRIVRTYLDLQTESDADWRCDLVCVYIDAEKESARIKWLKNIII